MQASNDILSLIANINNLERVIYTLTIYSYGPFAFYACVRAHLQQKRERKRKNKIYGKRKSELNNNSNYNNNEKNFSKNEIRK